MWWFEISVTETKVLKFCELREESQREWLWEKMVYLCCVQETWFYLLHDCKWKRRKEDTEFSDKVRLDLKQKGKLKLKLIWEIIACFIKMSIAFMGKIFVFLIPFRLKEKTYSLWPFLLGDQQRYVNPLYSSTSQIGAVLEPNTVSFNFK